VEVCLGRNEGVKSILVPSVSGYAVKFSGCLIKVAEW
jgi:hypothetical protein